MDSLSLLLKAKLAIEESAKEINSQQISKLQAKLEKLKLRIEIDDKTLSAITNFSKSIDKLNIAMEKQNETVRKNINVTQELDGSTKTVVHDIKRNGEIIETTTTKINKQTEAMQKQKQIVDSLSSSEETLASHTRRLSDGVQIGTTDVYKQGYITTTINQPEGGITSTTIKEDYEKRLKLSQQELDLLHKEALEMNKVYDASAKAFTEAEKRKREEVRKTAEYQAKEINRVQKEQYDSMLNEAYKMNKAFDDERQRLYNLGQRKNVSSFTGTDENSVRNYAKEIYGATAAVTQYSQSMDKQGRIVAEATVRVNKNSKEYTENKLKIDSATKSVNQFGDAVNKKTGKDMGILGQFKVALERFPVWIASATLVMGSIHQLKSSIQYIQQFDDAVVSLTKVVDLSDQQLNQMKETAVSLGKELGKSSVQIMQGMAEWGRITKDPLEIETLTKAATIASNVTSLSVADASKALTTTMISFKKNASESMDIINQWNEIQNNFRTSAEDMAAAIGKVGSVAQQSSTPIQELEGYITAVVSATGMAGDEVGTFLRSSMSRIFRLGADGEEDAGKSEEFLNSIGIAVRDTANQFRPFNEIIAETAIKYKELSNVQQIALAQQLSGTMHYPKMIALLENFNIAQEATRAAYNSQNSAMIENAKYIDSISGRISIFKTTLEGFYSNIVSSDFLKGLITSGTEFLNVIQRIVNTFGGWNIAFATVTITSIALAKALIGINTQLATSGALSFGNAIKMLIPAFFGLTTATAGLNTQLITMNLLTAGIPLLIGAITVGFMAYGNAQQKLKENTEAINNAHTDFNNTLKDFNNTLDVNKIKVASDALEALKKATNYENNIYKIQELRTEIESLEKTNTTQSARGYTYGVNDTSIESYKKQLSELEDKVKKVTDSENLYTEAKKLSTSLDYASVQSSSRNIASKLQEINANFKLVDSYQAIYEKLKNDQELTKEETALNDKLLKQYPEYTRLLGDKSKKLGVNFDALNSNIKAQQALATIELNTLKATAELESINTQSIIDNTNTRIQAIESEIKALEARNDMYLSTINPDDENAFKAESFYFRNAKRISDSSKMLAEAKNQLDRLNATKGAWDTLKDLNAEDLLNTKGVPGYFSPPDSDGKTPIPYENETDALIKSYNAEVENDKIKAKILEKQLKTAESAKDYNEQIRLSNELLSNQQKTIDDLKSANEKIHQEAENVRSRSMYDTTGWFDVNGEATLEYVNLLNTFAGKTDNTSKQAQQAIKDTFDSLYKLKKGWIDNSNAIDSMNESLISTSSNLDKINEDMITALENSQNQIINLLKKKYDAEADLEEEAYNKRKDSLDKSLDDYKKWVDDTLSEKDKLYATEDYNTKVGESTTKLNAIQSEINKYSSAAISGDLEAISKIAELQKEKDAESKSLKETQTNRERDLVKQQYQDNLTYYERFISDQQKIQDDDYASFKKIMEAKTTDTALQLEAQNILLNSSVETSKSIINELFSVTGENATIAGRLIQTELIDKLSQLMNIQKSLGDNATNLPSLKTVNPTSSLSSISLPNIGDSLKNLGSNLMNMIIPKINIPNFSNSSTAVVGGVNLQFDKLIQIDGSVDSGVMSKLEAYAPKIVNMTVLEIKKQLFRTGGK